MMLGELISDSYKAIKALLTRRVLIECDRIPYQFHNAPIRKILNWIIVEASIYFKPERAWGWPTHLQIEPSALCNLKCEFCPVAIGMERPTGYMAFSTFKRVIDEIGDCVFLILLWDWGEPFLNPAVYDMIAYAKQWDIKIVSSTNGHIFAGGDHAERLIRSGIDSIIFALDGISQETYEQYRAHGNVRTVIAGIERVVAAKRALNSTTPLINLRFLPMKHNEHEIPMLRELARSLGVDALTLKTVNPYDGGECSSDKADGNAFLPENPAYRRFEYDASGSRIRRKRNPCKQLWNNPVIHWNGKVSPCTYDPHDNYVQGDVTQQTFREIWWGVPYCTFRRKFRRDYQKIAFCSECSYAFEGGSCSTEIIAEAQFFNLPVRNGEQLSTT